ncbi:hypothetical protein FKM82_029896 [Ascaphus truei]
MITIHTPTLTSLYTYIQSASFPFPLMYHTPLYLSLSLYGDRSFCVIMLQSNLSVESFHIFSISLFLLHLSSFYPIFLLPIHLSPLLLTPIPLSHLSLTFFSLRFFLTLSTSFLYLPQYISFFLLLSPLSLSFSPSFSPPLNLSLPFSISLSFLPP